MKNAGYAHMGVGAAKGENKAEIASMAAISSPLLETSISGATGVLVCITASEDIELEEVNIASELIHSEADKEATIIWGATLDPSLHDEIRVTIIATGFSNAKTLSEKNLQAPTAKLSTPEAIAIEKEASSEEHLLEVLDEVAKAAEVNDDEAVAPPTPEKKPETIVNTIPSKVSAQNSYKGYDDIFSSIKRKNQGNNGN